MVQTCKVCSTNLIPGVWGAPYCPDDACVMRYKPVARNGVEMTDEQVRAAAKLKESEG